jgi:molybdate/tungstate transport system substrate-binding protein
MNTTRRFFIQFAFTAAASGFSYQLLRAEELSAIDVAYAGSMGSLMEGPIKASAAKSLHLDFHGRAQGSNALAQLIIGGSIRPDVFISVTPGPMKSVLKAGKATVADPIAHTEMVIAYSPKSRFAEKFDKAAKSPEANEVFQILQEPGLRFGRTDPVTDPQGRNIIFTMMLAERSLQKPGLADKIVGPTINEKQIFTEPTVMARLQSGELDAASAYKIQPGPFNLPFVPLTKTINLSGENLQAEHPDIKLTLGEKTFTPESLIYYAAQLKDAPNARGAASLIEWLKGAEGQKIFMQYQYDAPGNAKPLRS